jgi:hypothetical protein
MNNNPKKPHQKIFYGCRAIIESIVFPTYCIALYQLRIKVADEKVIAQIKITA